MSRNRRNPYAHPDARSKAARAQGYPARSVFKLSEIDTRLRLLSRGQRVLDLGAAPGSWARYAAERIGPGGKLLALDLQDVAGLPGGVRFIQGDVLTLPTTELAAYAPYDVVLSDMAPSTSGSKIRDQAKSLELYLRALEIAGELGNAGAAFVGKLFMSGDFADAKRRTQRLFNKVQVIRPQGTKKPSSEVFVVGIGKKPAD